MTFRNRIKMVVVAAAMIAGSLPALPARAAGTVTVKGSDTMVVLGQRWAEEYMKKNPKTVIQVTGGGSGTGISALINGTTDVCEASRSMKDAEKKQLAEKAGAPPVEIPVAKDGLSVYVHESNPLTELSMAQLKAIFTGKVTSWKEVGGPDAKIIPYSRENSSGTYVFFKEHVLENADYTPRAQNMPGTAAVVNAVSKEKFSIGYGGAAYAKGIKILKIKKDDKAPAIGPSDATIKDGSYPLSRPLFFYTRTKPSADITGVHGLGAVEGRPGDRHQGRLLPDQVVALGLEAGRPRARFRGTLSADGFATNRDLARAIHAASARRSWRARSPRGRTLTVVVYGDAGVLARAAASAGVPAPAPARVRAVTALDPGAVPPGKPNDAGGQAQLAYLEAATTAALAGDVAALVTAPISKQWIARAGFAFPGHTEYLAARAGVREFAMMLAGPTLRVTVATTHVALRDVATLLTVDGIASTIWLTAEALARRFGIAAPRVAVAGLNPHAGEGGPLRRRGGAPGPAGDRARPRARLRPRARRRDLRAARPRRRVPGSGRRPASTRSSRCTTTRA